MNITELLIIAVGLAMDAFAVSIAKGLSVERIEWQHPLKAGVWFGGFQALMPLVGYLVGVSFAERVAEIDHWIAFILLGVIGMNMIRDSFAKDDEPHNPDFSARTMLVLAVATSIDALAVGISFSFLKVDIILAVAIIGVVTLLLSMLGVKIGNLFGNRYKSKAEFTGGAVLTLMGLKILLEHTLQ